MKAKTLRTRREKNLFAGCLVVSIAVWLMLPASGLGVFCGIFSGIIIFAAHAVRIACIRGHDVKRLAKQLPGIYAKVLSAAEKLDLSGIRGMAGTRGYGVKNRLDPITFCLLAMSLCVVSCQSSYVHLHYEAHHGAVRNADLPTQIAFVASTSAYLPATGIERFPDGGTPTYLLQNVSLYTFDTQTGQITRQTDFNDLARLIGISKSKWKIKLGFKGSAILYHVAAVNSWDLHAKWKKHTIPIEQVEALKKKYEQCYLFDINTQKAQIIEARDFQDKLRKFSESTRISLTRLNQLLNNIELAQLGLIANRIMPKSDNEYIEETIYLKNDSKVTRRAVVEQIIFKKSVNDIKALLEKMDQYKSGLKGAKRQQFEISSQETYSAIRNLLPIDCRTQMNSANHPYPIEDYVEVDR